MTHQCLTPLSYKVKLINPKFVVLNQQDLDAYFNQIYQQTKQELKMAKINKEQPVDPMFAYHIAKDITQLEGRIEALENQPKPEPQQPTPPPEMTGLVFGDKRYENIGYNNQRAIYRQVISPPHIPFLLTGISAEKNGLYYGDRPDDGRWQTMFTYQIYDRVNGKDIEVKLPSVEQVKKLTFDFTLENWRLHRQIIPNDDVLGMSFEQFQAIIDSTELFELYIDDEKEEQPFGERYLSYTDRPHLKLYYRGELVYDAEVVATDANL